jgi:hypothetical protein
MPVALRHFRVVILIQIGVERNERVIQESRLLQMGSPGAITKSALGPHRDLYIATDWH